MTVRSVIGDAAYEIVEPHILAALRGGDVRFEMKLPYKQAGLRDVRVQYVSHRDAAGEVVGFFELIDDVSELKAAQRELTELVQGRDELFAIVGHELRGPLQAIGSIGSLLQVSAQSGQEKVIDLRALGGALARQSTQSKRLVDDMLDLSRACRRVLSPAHRIKGPPLRVKLPDRSVYIVGDAGRLEQCVYNLLYNSEVPAGRRLGRTGCWRGGQTARDCRARQRDWF